METENKKFNKKKAIGILAALIVVGAIAGSAYLLYAQRFIFTDNAAVEVQQIDLSSKFGGTLEEVMVNEGDTIQENFVVARVGNELIKAKSGGIATKVNNNIGKNVNKGEAIVSMIDPSEIRVVATIDENKGLSDIRIGQRAEFTVDAFGSKKYVGVVDEISETSHQSGVVFNISDKREIKQFDVKIRFNIDEYPELKNGMSAKVTIYK
jgi:multidrug resistance efflux pump